MITHFSKIIKEEDQVILNLQDSKEDPSEIISIHFGTKNYAKYKLLL